MADEDGVMANEDSMEQDRSGTVVPPPLLFGVPFVAGLLVELAVSTSLLPGAGRWAVGGLLLLAGVSLEAWAFVNMRRAHTSPSVWAPTTALVRTGPYRFTRNPIYLGFALSYLGAAVLFDSLWPVVLLPVALVAVHYGAVRREEAYLERKFGDAYREYKRRVRRWL